MVFAYIFLIIIHLVPFLIPAQYLWGSDTWFYSGPLFFAGYILITGAMVLLIIRKYDFNNIIELINIKYAQYFLPVIFGILFISLSQSNYFLGDGFLRIRNIEAGLKFSLAEPFDTYIHSLLYQLTNKSLGFTGADVYKWASIIAGVIVVSYTSNFSRKLFNNSNSILFTLIIMTLYSSQMFFGYVESYSLVLMFLIFMQLSMLKDTKYNERSFSPIVYFNLGLLLHPVSIIFLPLLIWHYKNSIKYILIIVISVISSILLILLLSVITGYGIGKVIDSMGSGNHLLPLFSNNDSYGIFSIGHFIDIFNLLLMFWPVLLLVNYIKRKPFLTKGFILTYTAPFLFILLFKPELGFSRDWDLFTLAIIPLLLFITYKFFEIGNFNQFIIHFLILSILNFMPWVILNSNEEMSLSRAEGLSKTGYWSNKSVARITDELMQYHYDKGNKSIALEFGKVSYERDSNERILYSIASIEYSNGNYLQAGYYFKKLLASGYKQQEVLVHLGESSLKNGKYDESLKYFQNALENDSNNVELIYNIAFSYFKMSNTEKAIEYFSNILDRQPDSFDALSNLGEIYFQQENYPKAIEVYNKLISMNPDEPSHYYNLSLIYANINEISTALKYAKVAQNKGFNPELSNDLINTLSGMK